MSTIELKGLSRVYGDLTAVNAIDLHVGAGEVVCLLGPSGCGKTTTLRMIAGLEEPTAGEIYIGGRRVNGLRPHKRDVAMVFQFYALYPTLTVAENLCYPLHAERLSPEEMEARVRRVSAMLSLDEVLARLPAELAEGEKQRVAVGRAIIRDPSCFLFDEPLSRLDVQLREKMRSQIKEVLGSLNKATVIVTHDQLEALTMADRIAVMRSGVIEQVASPHEIFNRPKNLFVASFIGTPQMNILPAVLIGQDGDGVRFKLGDSCMRLDVNPAVRRLAPGTRVTLGVRPRSVELLPDGAADTLAATVDLVEPMGAEALLHLIGEGHALRVVVHHRLTVDVGSRVHLRFRPGQVHVFDESEQRVS